MTRYTIVLMLILAGAAQAQQTADWFPFTANSNPAAGEIGMHDWLDRPAGKFGRIARDGERLMYDGKAIKLWGLNLCYDNCLPPKERADARAAFYPKYGINTVCLQKFTEYSYQTGESVTDYSPDAIDRMDYQVAKFEEAGIYVNLSVHFGAAMLGAGVRKYVSYIDEMGTFQQRGNPARSDRADCSTSWDACVRA